MTTPAVPEPPPPEGRVAVAAVVLVLALAFGLTVLVVSGDGEGDGQASSGAGGGPTETVAVDLGDLFVEPDRVEVPAGSRLEVEVTNTGDLEHDLKLEGEDGTERLAPGETRTADFGVIDADAEAWCTVPGHKDAGMVLAIAVTEATTTTTTPPTTAPARSG